MKDVAVPPVPASRVLPEGYLMCSALELPGKIEYPL